MTELTSKQIQENKEWDKEQADIQGYSVPSLIKGEIKLSDLECKDGVCKCPVCDEYEFRNIKIFYKDDAPIDTEDWECDNPDCKAKYFQTESNYLIPTN